MIKGLKKTKGITLVALVVTIVVLLILATVTMSMTLSNNVIFERAKNATTTYKQAAANESAALNDIDSSIEDAVKGINSQVGKYKDTQAVVSATSNTAIKDDEENTITIPVGFKIASDSATTQEDGIVIEDKDGNQYVWIPVSDIANYKRTDLGIKAGTYSNYLETLPSDEQTSVSTYHGYYIGRYEAGDVTSTVNKTLRASGASATSKVSIQKGQAPYNYVTKDQANTLAIGIKTAEGYTATTKLCSSYAWDTAVNFIQNKVANYATSSNQGNYHDTTFTYTDITGATQTKSLGSDALIPTGETSPICNIYDMGGNDWEWTSEATNDSGNPYVNRGGGYFNSYSGYPSGCRNFFTTPYPDYNIAFRATLYM